MYRKICAMNCLLCYWILLSVLVLTSIRSTNRGSGDYTEQAFREIGARLQVRDTRHCVEHSGFALRLTGTFLISLACQCVYCPILSFGRLKVSMG